jgi:DNA polymerase III delta prime subunit
MDLIPPKTRLKLTPTQLTLYQELTTLIRKLPIIIVRGERFTGKDYVIQRFFRDHEITPVEFDLCDLSSNLSHRVNSQDITTYLQKLQEQAGAIADKSKRYIYIRRLDRIADILADFKSENGSLLHLAIRRWCDRLPKHFRVIITSEYNTRFDSHLHWVVELHSSSDDVRALLERKNVPPADITTILKIATIQVPGHVQACLKYARAKPEALVSRYREAYARLTNTQLNADRDVVQPELSADLIGMEYILDEINTSIIRPIELNHPEVTIKKGIVLCGPPGTGKTSIGRWLAHQLKGKLYLVGGEVGVSGSAFVNTIEENLKLAYRNAPAVVFVDDVDKIFEHSDSYRAFLTLLDGLDNKKRTNVCMIVTCMDLRKVPASLIRGGRLEMCLQTRLPTSDSIIQILHVGVARLLRTLTDLSTRGDLPADLVSTLEPQLTPDFYRSQAIRMLGWNCADINRCTNDVLRLIVVKKGSQLDELFAKCVRQIRDQYDQCSKTESSTPSVDVSAMYS